MSKTEMVTRRMLRLEAVKSIATAAGGIFAAPSSTKESTSYLPAHPSNTLHAPSNWSAALP